MPCSITAFGIGKRPPGVDVKLPDTAPKLGIGIKADGSEPFNRHWPPAKLQAIQIGLAMQALQQPLADDTDEAAYLAKSPPV